MTRITGLLKLYRADSFFITVLSFFITLLIIGMKDFSFQLILMGLSLGMVFVNFIYSINSYYDAGIDAINKPHRPIPSGTVSKKAALYYIIFLAALSLSLPFLFANIFRQYVILYSFPIIGILYSNPFYPLKKKAFIASIFTAILLLLPAAIAVMYANLWGSYWHYLALIFLYCLCLVPLKDIEDVEGDVAHHSGNWSNIIGEKKLVMASLTGITFLLLLVVFFRNISGVALLAVVFLSAAMIEVYYLITKQPLSTIYKSLIRANIMLLVVGTLVFYVWHRTIN